MMKDDLIPDWGLNELIDALRSMSSEKDGENDPGLTAHEIARLLGRHENAVYRQLKKLHDRGKLVVGWRRTTRLDGQQCRVPVYRLKTED